MTMTIVTLGNGYVEVKGHSGYAEYGKDIVCAAISTLVEATYNYLLATKNKVEKDDDDGLFIIETKEPLNKAGERIFNEFKSMIYDLSIQYPNNILIFKLL